MGNAQPRVASMQGGAKASPTFDPAAWLGVWADNGGIALRTSERLYLARSPTIDREASATLDRLQFVIAQPGAAEALRDYLDRRQNGEA
jgi:hypothetical protein